MHKNERDCEVYKKDKEELTSLQGIGLAVTSEKVLSTAAVTKRKVDEKDILRSEVEDSYM